MKDKNAGAEAPTALAPAFYLLRYKRLSPRRIAYSATST